MPFLFLIFCTLVKILPYCFFIWTKNTMSYSWRKCVSLSGKHTHEILNRMLSLSTQWEKWEERLSTMRPFLLSEGSFWPHGNATALNQSRRQSCSTKPDQGLPKRSLLLTIVQWPNCSHYSVTEHKTCRGICPIDDKTSLNESRCNGTRKGCLSHPNPASRPCQNLTVHIFLLQPKFYN